jgi:murein L,D-transpeptidase YafK
MKTKIFFALILLTNFLANFAFAENYNVDEVRVYKTRHRMEMLFDGKITKVYTVMLGRGGMAPKVQEGDKRVPEGKYILDFKNPHSKFYRSIHISYPNAVDIERAKKLGVKPGGDIFVHGMPNYFVEPDDIDSILPKVDWTAGCIAVTNSEMADIWDSVDVPVPITIFN